MKQTLQLLKKHQWAILAWAALILISSNLKLGILVGSETATLSLLVATMPVIAYFFSGYLAVPLAIGAWMCTHLTWPIPLTMGIPTLLATLSWRASSERKSINDYIINLILPIACMALFCFSPIGAQAWAYSLYWLIPAIAFFVPMGIFGRALQSTFVAHAVGSVIWVYFVPMPPQAWLSLIPVVAVERLFISSWSLVMIGILSYAKAEQWQKNQQKLTSALAETRQ